MGFCTVIGVFVGLRSEFIVMILLVGLGGVLITIDLHTESPLYFLCMRAIIEIWMSNA